MAPPSPKGRGLFPILVALRQWSEEFDEHPDEIATALVDRANRRPVRKLLLTAEDGRVLAPEKPPSPRGERGRPSAEPAAAAQPQMLLGLKVRHA